MSGTQYSQYLRIGPAFLFWRVALNADYGITFTSAAAGGVSPDPILNDFIWPTTGMFIGHTDNNIDIKPIYKETEYTEGLAGAPTDVVYEDQAYEVNAVLQYNIVDEIISFGLLPGSLSAFDRTDGVNYNPDEGSLVILLTNIRNSDEQYHSKVKVVVLRRARVKPGGFALNGGHSGVRVGFKTLAARQSDGCVEVNPKKLSRLYTINYLDPNNATMPDGSVIDTTPDNPLLIGDMIYLNLD